MRIIQSNEFAAGPRMPVVQAALDRISEAPLEEWVKHLARPRNYVAERNENRAVADWLEQTFKGMGLHVERQGKWENIAARRVETGQAATVVVAHYDSVPNSPGADDNASAVAAMLGCAAAISKMESAPPVVCVAVNREEDGFLGSMDFVEHILQTHAFDVKCAHVLEMVGCASRAPGSQRRPTGLPVDIGDVGDFLGLLSNDQSRGAMEEIFRKASTYVPGFPVKGLSIVPGAEQAFPVLARSDHVPFWRHRLPAVLWTDTAEFRNANYHSADDTAETLNFPFLRAVTALLTACVADA